MKNNWHKILLVLIGLFLVWWVVFVITPKFQFEEEYKKKIESLDTNIQLLNQNNLKLEETLKSNLEMVYLIDKNITSLKNQEVIIKEIYHEKIKNIDKLTVAELDSFFSKRYGY
jgi:hypothetical protein